MQTTQTPAAAPAKPAGSKPPRLEPPPEFRSEKIDAMNEAGLIGVLKDSGSTTFQKAKASQRLALVGTRAAVPALAALLPDPQLSMYARYGLQPINDASADEALRNAAPKLKGILLVGVLNSLGHRRDVRSVPMLGNMLSDSDPLVAQAAAAALGKISGGEAAKALQAALPKSSGAVRSAVADGILVCAEGLLAAGGRTQALGLYNALTAADIPKPFRHAAMRGIIGAETSLNRPREAPVSR